MYQLAVALHICRYKSIREVPGRCSGWVRRMGVPSANMISGNRWHLLQSECGIGLLKAEGRRRGGVSPGGAAEAACPLAQAWADKVFQWPEGARPKACDLGQLPREGVVPPASSC